VGTLKPLGELRERKSQKKKVKNIFIIFCFGFYYMLNFLLMLDVMFGSKFVISEEKKIAFYLNKKLKNIKINIYLDIGRMTGNMSSNNFFMI